MIRADFLTSDYDITFSNVKRKDRCKRRSEKDRYEDFCMLPPYTVEDIVFFGGKDHLPLFARLTASIRARKSA